MKVALIDPSLFTWPYDRALAGGMDELGMDVRIYGRALPAQDPRNDDPLFVPHFYGSLASPLLAKLPRAATRAWKGFSHIGDMRRLADALAEWRPDAIHFQWLPLPVVDQRFLARFGRIAPLLLTVHDTLPFNGNAGSSLQNVGAKDVWSAFERLIVHTHQGEERLREQGIAPSRIERIAHGLLNESLLNESQTAPSQPAASDAPVDFLLFGQIKPYKGIDVAIRAYARLDQSVRARCRLRIVGKPYMDTAPLIELARSLGVEDQVLFDFRFVPDGEMVEMLARADALLFPYREIEASGVLMAAIAHGRPLIASRLGAFGELIKDGENGFLVEPGDDRALAAAMSLMILQPERREIMAEGMTRLRQSIPSWCEIARQTAGIYRELAASPTADWTPAAASLPAGERSHAA